MVIRMTTPMHDINKSTPSRPCRGVRVCGHSTTAMHDNEYTLTLPSWLCLRGCIAFSGLPVHPQHRRSQSGFAPGHARRRLRDGFERGGEAKGLCGRGLRSFARSPVRGKLLAVVYTWYQINSQLLIFVPGMRITCLCSCFFCTFYGGP